MSNVQDNPDAVTPTFSSNSYPEETFAERIHEERAKSPESPPLGFYQAGQGLPNVTDGEMYVPGLTSSSLFTVVPETDSLSVLVERYVPQAAQPKRNREWRGKTVDELVSCRRWRGAAEACRQAIMSSSAESTTSILQNWTLRLYALLQLSLFDHFGTELTAIFALLPSSAYFDIGTSIIGYISPMFHPIIPFELHVFLACLPGLRGEKEKTIESLGIVLRAAKCEMWTAKRVNDSAAMIRWRLRADTLGRMMASALTELRATSSVFSMLSQASHDETLPISFISLCRLEFSTGFMQHCNTTAFKLSDTQVDDRETTTSVKRLAAHRKVSNGEWIEAEKDWRIIVDKDPQDLEALNNLAVVLLFNKKLSEAIEVMTGFLTKSPFLGYSSETILFNLATLLELRMDTAHGAKIHLLGGVVQHGGEGVNAGCLKLPM